MSSVTLPPLHEFLTPAERQNLEDAFISAGIVYDVITRNRLLDGVNRFYVSNQLDDSPKTPSNQLWDDLRRMNLVERLSDGTVPLAQWLRNAARRFRGLPEAKIVETLLIKVTGTGEPTTVELQPQDTPPAEFEEIITDGIDDLQYVSFLSLGAKRLDAVAKIWVPRYHKGQKLMLPDNSGPMYGHGTGWLIAQDLIVTNHHVVRNRLQSEPVPDDDDLKLQALDSQAQFFYDVDDQAGRKVKVSELIAIGKGRDKDFALLRLAEKVNVDILPVLSEKVNMPETQQSPKGTIVKALAVNIIQHPGGGPKRVALRNNLVFAADYPHLHYFTDTLSGSSGSPVFDDTWRVVALHRAAVQRTAEFNGRTLGYVNEGVQMHAIFAELAQRPEAATALQQIKDEQSKYSD